LILSKILSPFLLQKLSPSLDLVIMTSSRF